MEPAVVRPRDQTPCDPDDGTQVALVQSALVPGLSSPFDPGTQTMTAPPAHQVSLFLSYARDDDEPFVRRLHDDLEAYGLDVWFDRVSMPSRALTFIQEIRDAISARDRLVLVVGPDALASEYVEVEWRWVPDFGKPVTPVLRLGEYDTLPDELKLLDARDSTADPQLRERTGDPRPPALRARPTDGQAGGRAVAAAALAEARGPAAGAQGRGAGRCAPAAPPPRAGPCGGRPEGGVSADVAGTACACSLAVAW